MKPDRHCFLQMTEKLILIYLTDKIFENRIINTKDMGENVENKK
jgi:hypothetical protein